jgi:hypothetical protein
MATIISENVDVEWSGARGPGFDFTHTQTQDSIYSEALISLLSDNRLKNVVML